MAKVEVKKCGVCLEPFKEANEVTFSEECQHTFCRDCLSIHITCKIQDFNEVNCLEMNCAVTLGEDSTFIKELPLYQKRIYYKILVSKD